MTDVLDEQRDQLVRNLDNVETRLRRLADKVAQERERIQYVPQLGAASFSDIFTGVMNDILWGVANMNIPQFCNNAAWADMEIERRRPKECEVD